MVGNFREALAGAFPDQEHKLLFYQNGSKHPPYNELTVAETLKRFCDEIVSAPPLRDPRGKVISIMKTHFPKLAGLKHKTLSKEDLNASGIISAIEDGSFDIGDYDPARDDRFRSLFWIPEVLLDPDAIYKNAHKIVVGDEVYVRVYDKMGSKIKLVFTLDVKQRGKIIRTVPTTSFLSDPATAVEYVRGEPLYRRK